jgi:hypothetical protein
MIEETFQHLASEKKILHNREVTNIESEIFNCSQAAVLAPDNVKAYFLRISKKTMGEYKRTKF